MKVFVYADPHWSAYSSIVRSRSDKYSLRLENLINTINWVESEAVRQSCTTIICLGDFFDKAELNSEELTALQDIRWANLSHIFIVGNHEMGRSNLQFSSSHIFKLCPNATVIDRPVAYDIGNNNEFCFLPYILENDRKPLVEYFPVNGKNKVIFSHNDIKGITMGRFESVEGFSISEIKENCKLFVNGHIHNGSYISDSIVNVGNITGQNFSEDAKTYKHVGMVYNTDTGFVTWHTNPYAFNFYKLDFTAYKCNTEQDAKNIDSIIKSLSSNAVVTAKTNIENNTLVKDLISVADNIIEARVIVDITTITEDKVSITSSDFAVDHLSRFIDYVKEYIGTGKEIVEELAKVVEG